MAAVHATLLCAAMALVCTILRAQRPEMAMATALAASAAVLFLLRNELNSCLELIRTLADASGLTGEDTGLLLRASGIAIIGQFGAALCLDAGESALAERIGLGMRVVLLAMAAPLLGRLLDLVRELSA